MDLTEEEKKELSKEFQIQYKKKLLDLRLQRRLEQFNDRTETYLAETEEEDRKWIKQVITK